MTVKNKFKFRIQDKAEKISKKPLGMRIKLFGWLALFIVFVLAVLWLFQVVWLDDIYQAIKLSELEKSAELLAINAENENIQTLSDRIAQDKSVCISIYKINNMTGVSIAYSHVRPDCLLHRLSSENYNRMYSEAKKNNGTHIERISLDAFRNLFYTEGDYLGSVPSDDSGMPESIIYSRVVKLKSSDADVLIMLNTSISPVDSTVSTLRLQLLWISGILLFGAMLLAAVISKIFTAPIADMNKAAKTLASGNYDVEFKGGSFREITELSETLNYAASELSKVDRTQKELIANISHDLRTPLTMIGGYSEVMRDIPGEMTPENIQVIIDETARLSSLVNDILDVSRLQSGVCEMKCEPFNLTETIRQSLLRYSKLTERDGYTIKFEPDSESDVYVNADKTRILQVLYNLINNAVNYTGEDKTVTIRQICRENDGIVRIEIIDTGEGIEEDKLPYIWERYYKVDKIHKRGAVGSGLGLSIVKNVLTAHNALFGVSSEIGHGSTFWFEMKIFKK